MITLPFLLVTLSSAAYYMSVGVFIPTLPVFIENGFGYGEAMIGAAAVAFSGAAVLVRPGLTWVGNTWGLRVLMATGGFLGAVAALGLVMVTSPWQVLPLRALTGIGEAALFVGAATLIVEFSPDNRKAEGASYLSVAVFGGLSLGPIIGEWVMGDVAETARGLGVGRFDGVFVVAAGLCLLSGIIPLVAPGLSRVGRMTTSAVRVTPRRSLLSRWLHPKALVPGALMALGIAAWTSFNAFVPTYAKELGLGGSAAFFTFYSIVCLVIRLFGARLPETIGLHRSVGVALTSIMIAVVAVAVLGSGLGIWIGTFFFAIGASFLYPSLLAMAVQDTSDDERVEVVASFTMFFEVGGVVGGLGLGAVGEIWGKRTIFMVATIFAVAGLVLLSSRARATRLSEPSGSHR
ncbi:MAG: MFS transporter [Actinomycetota bacterium]